MTDTPENPETFRSEQTPQKPRPPHLMNGNEDGIPFSKENQPSPEAKSKGWAKRKRGIALLSEILNMKFKGAPKSEIRKNVAEYFDVDPDDITNEQVMIFRQIEKSIQKADTIAFKTLMERNYGYPQHDVTSGGEKLSSTTGLEHLSFEQLKEIVKDGDSQESEDSAGQN